MLSIRSLRKTFPGSVQALQGLDLDLHRGEFAAVIGPSGAGKSTLLRCINRLVTPDSGTVHFEKQPMHSLHGKTLRRARMRIGMIFQSFALVDRLTVRQNILCGALGRTAFLPGMFGHFATKDRERAAWLASRVGLEGMLDRRADALSGGQRQRVGIARALLQNPHLLLVDEPTASLDPRTARQIMRLLADLAAEQGIGILLNSHDVLLAKEFAARMIGLSKGKVVFDGLPTALDNITLDRIYGGEDWHSQTPDQET